MTGRSAATWVWLLGGSAVLGAWGSRNAMVQPRTDLPVEHVFVDGLRRDVRFYVPAPLARPPALVILLHGSGGNGARLREFTGRTFERLADEHGFVVAYPDALGGQWRDCRAEAPYQKALAGIDDTKFLRAVVRVAAQRAGAAIVRAFALGYSNGGQMVFRLAWEAPQVFVAFAAVGAHLPVPDERACTPSADPVSMLLVSGTDDPINPWAGGVVRLGDAVYGRVVSAEETAAYFRSREGLPADPVTDRYPDRVSDDGATVEARRWSAAGRGEVMLMIVRGGGHTLPLPEPHFPVEIVGPTSRDVNGAAIAWEFFSRSARAAAGHGR